jgi:hypothetical protein
MEFDKIHSEHNAVFWFHLFITLLAFAAPFLFSWYWIVPIYLLVLLQFKVFNRCLLNARHSMDDTNTTFYSYLLLKSGFSHDIQLIKKFVRGPLYWILAGVTLFWQIVLKQPPFFF